MKGIGLKMYIDNLKIQNFRNYKYQEINFENKINIFYGDNAQGKTNILESIFISSFGKSFRTNKDKELIKMGENFLKIQTHFQKKDRDGEIRVEISDKKNVYLNDVKLKKLSEVLGNIILVIFTPDDINLLKSGPSARRKFLDMMIGQLRPAYVLNLNSYLKTLDQRNNFLKQKIKNDAMLDIWDEKLAEYGERVFIYRKQFLDLIKHKITSIHAEITDEKIDINYSSDFKNKQDFLDLLKRSRQNDYYRGYTTKGIHRDDFTIYINNEPVNIYGSQGQNRTAILSLKLAELNVIYDDLGEYPIFLLDDFMSELDEKRIANFLNNIENIQVIITCTKNIDIKNSVSHHVIKGKII